MALNIRTLDWSGAIAVLVLFVTTWLPLDAVLNQPQYGLSGWIGTGTVWVLVTLFRLPRRRAGAKPERGLSWRSVVALLLVLALVPLVSLAYGLLWLHRDGTYSAALLINAAVSAAFTGVLARGAVLRRREGSFR